METACPAHITAMMEGHRFCSGNPAALSLSAAGAECGVLDAAWQVLSGEAL